MASAGNEPSSLFVDELGELEGTQETVESLSSQASTQSDVESGNTTGFMPADCDARLAPRRPPLMDTGGTNDRKRRVKPFEARSDSATGAPTSPSNTYSSPEIALTNKGSAVREMPALSSDSSPMKRSRNASRRGQK
jgi:hypothetical protein